MPLCISNYAICVSTVVIFHSIVAALIKPVCGLADVASSENTLLFRGEADVSAAMKTIMGITPLFHACEVETTEKERRLSLLSSNDMR